jgi:hypothetical protein
MVAVGWAVVRPSVWLFASTDIDWKRSSATMLCFATRDEAEEFCREYCWVPVGERPARVVIVDAPPVEETA